MYIYILYLFIYITYNIYIMLIISIGFSNETIRIERSDTAFKSVEEAFFEIQKFYNDNTNLHKILPLLEGKYLYLYIFLQ